MRATDIIEKKRDGGELTREEIEFFVSGYTSGDIPDYQAAAWCMAVYFRSMSARETAELLLLVGRLVQAEGYDGELSPAQWMALRFLARANSFSRTPSAFAEFQATTRGTASQAIKALEAGGYLVRQQSEADGRSVSRPKAGWRRGPRGGRPSFLRLATITSSVSPSRAAGSSRRRSAS